MNLFVGDLVPLRRWKLCDVHDDGSLSYYIAILQGESRSEFNSSQYSRCMKHCVGFTPVEPPNGGTYVTHHMVFQKKYVKELMDLMKETTKSDLPMPKLIMSLSRKFYRFSEYKTYCSFMVRNHPEDFNHHPLPEFGEGGIRFREANCVIDEMLNNCTVSYGGLSYDQVKTFALNNWKSLAMGDVLPAYIQLDHVYGLKGIDIESIPFKDSHNNICLVNENSSEILSVSSNDLSSESISIDEVDFDSIGSNSEVVNYKMVSDLDFYCDNEFEHSVDRHASKRYRMSIE